MKRSSRESEKTRERGSTECLLLRFPDVNVGACPHGAILFENGRARS